MTEGYCNKCKSRREISNTVEEITKDGRRVIKGFCNSCGTEVIKIASCSSEVTPSWNTMQKIRVN